MALRLFLACAILLALPSSAIAAEPALVGPASISEAGGTATFTVSCGETNVLLTTVANTGALTVSVADGPAPPTAPEDHGSPSPAVVTCLPGTTGTVQAVTVPITNDTLDEQNEKFTVNVNGVLVGPLAPVALSAETTITDDDPIASIAPVAFIVEGDSGTAAVELAVTLSSAPVQATTVAFSTDDLTAAAGSDYTATSGNLVFQPGELTKTISVPVMGDTVPEGPEGFFVNLTSTDNGSLNATKKQGGVGIFDNDKSPLPTVSLPKSVSIEEGNGGTTNLLFEVNLSAAASERTEVKWKTANFTANQADYDSANGRVVFQKGQRTKTVSVDVKGDRRDEPDEAFAVTLSDPVAAALGQTKAAFGIIEDDDGPKVKIGKPKVRGKRVVAKVTCPDSADGCKGRLVGKAGKLKLGRKRFELAKGQSKKLKLKMSKKARNKLADQLFLRAKLTATASDSSGDTLATTRKARLKQPR